MKHRVIVRLMAITLIFLIVSVGFVNNIGIANETSVDSSRGSNSKDAWSEPVEIAKFDYTYVPSPVALVIDNGGDWHIVYSDRILYENKSERSFIKYKTAKTTETIAEIYGNIFDDIGGGVGHPSIAIDKSGGLHVTYIFWSNNDLVNQSVMYLKKEAGKTSWSDAKEIARFDYIWIPSRSAIAIDSNGDWHIVYSDRDRDDGGADKRYIKYKNKSTTETLAEGYGNIFTGIGEGVGNPSIAIDQNGVLHVSYIYLDYTKLSDQVIMFTTKKINSQSWSTAKKLTTFDYSFKPSYSNIAVDSSGDWHIAYPDMVDYGNNSDRRFVKYKNERTTETLAEGFGKIFEGTGEGVGYPAIAIGPDDELHAIYTHLNYPEATNQTIMYTKREAPDGSSNDTGSGSESGKDEGATPGFELLPVLICIFIITIKYRSKKN